MASRFSGPRDSGGDPLVGLYREMNRLVDDVLGGAFSAGPSGGFLPTPSLDMHERDDALWVSIELPGVRAADVDLRLEGDTLTVSGEKRRGSDPQAPAGGVQERRYGRFSRSVTLPFRPDPDTVHADCEDGVLTICLRRAQPADSRRIPVRGAGDASGADRSDAARGTPASPPSAGVGKPGGSTPAPRNDEAGYAVSPGSATEGSGSMGSSGTEAASSRSVGP